MRYRKYLSSSHWKNLKKKLPNYCAVCGTAENLETHHLFYRQHWSDSRTIDLLRLCHECHRITHSLLSEGKILRAKTPTMLLMAVRKFRSETPGLAKKVKISKIEYAQDLEKLYSLFFD